jgi:8-oxo-dGTP diphosphatase
MLPSRRNSMAKHYRHSVSVAGVAVDDAGRVLVIKRRDNGEWQAPGGILEASEQIEEGLRREIFEETGVQIEPEQLTDIYKHMGLGVVALVFRCRAVGGVAGPTDESVAAEWRMPDEVLAEMTEAFAIRVQDALSGPWPHVRAPDGQDLVKA